jgi:hypothetical protein
VAGPGSARLAPCLIADPATHPAALIGIHTAPHALGLIRGERVLQAVVGNRAGSAYGLRRKGGFLGLIDGEEHVDVEVATRRLGPPALLRFPNDVVSECCQRMPLLSSCRW